MLLPELPCIFTLVSILDREAVLQLCGLLSPSAADLLAHLSPGPPEWVGVCDAVEISMISRVTCWQRRRHEGGEALVAERVASEIDHAKTKR